MFKPDSALSNKFVVVAIAPAAAEKHKSAKPVTGGSRDTVRNKSSDHVKAAEYVWVQHGDTLLQKKVRIGLNDNTRAEVLSGLSEDESVITGMQRVTAKEAAAATSGASPFMPQRRRR
jgi:HlyD family secretion protein